MRNHRTIRLGAAILGAVIFITAGLPAFAADAYVTHLESGLNHLRAAQPRQAAQDFRSAMDEDANDPAAWLAFGALLLSVRQVTPARAALHQAARLAPDSYRTAMALALCDLADGKPTEADALFAKAAQRGAPFAAEHRAYLAAMRGSRSTTGENQTGATSDVRSPLSSAVNIWLADEAGAGAAAWETLLPPPGTEAHPALLAAFTPWKPFNFGWQGNEHVPGPPALPAGKPISGAVPLTAKAASDTRYVVFTVDGVDVGITNVRPYTWTWATSSVPNGTHALRLTAIRADGSRHTQEMRVTTQNAKAPAPRAHPGIETVNRLLDQALSLQPDLRYARYRLAQGALTARDEDAARARLQAVVAADPKYRNAAQLLKGLPRDTDGAEVWRGPAGRKLIALTFDDGPQPGRTTQLLDLLKRLDVRGTFFFVGKQAALYPEVVRRAAAEGHEVGNHTWNHPNLNKLSEFEALRELASANRILGSLAGRAPRFFRPPGGNINDAAREAGAALNLTPAMWTFLGGKTEGMPVEIMAPEFIQAAQPGAIFLIHDGTKKIAEMLPIVVEKLRADGYEFVTLSELMDSAPDSIRTAAGQ